MHPFDRTIWAETTFPQDELPPWPCPFCWSSHLILKKPFQGLINQSADSPEDVTHLFIGELQCAHCNELVAVTGELSVDVENYSTPTGFEGRFVESFTPKYFLPNLKLFYLQEYFPSNIVTVIDRAFSLFFSDIHASANMIRVAVEKILDLNKFGKIPRKTSKNAYLALAARIDCVKDAKVKNSLKAIKWIGNYGAHLDEKRLNRDNLLDAFEILHSILEDAFSTRTKKIQKKANKINKKHKRKP